MAAELSGQYGSTLNLRDIAVGPQFLYPRGKMLFFGHVLIGDARSLVRVGTGEEDTARAVALGGGMDLDISSRFAFRVFQVDYLRTQFIFGEAKQFAVFDRTGLSLGLNQEGEAQVAPVSLADGSMTGRVAEGI